MGTVSVSVPDELKERMSKLEHINWSSVARKAFEQEVNDMESLKRIVAKSRLTPKDARKIADKIDKAVSKKFSEMADADRRRRKSNHFPSH